MAKKLRSDRFIPAPGLLVLAVWLLWHLPLGAAPLRLLAIGDSLTTEYAIELTFSAPDSDPSNPNTRNWVEIFASRRSSAITLSSGNFAIPGSTADYWDDVLTDTSFNPLTLALRLSIDQELDTVNAAIIFLGGNDLNSAYGSIYNDATTPAALTGLAGHISAVHSFIRSRAPNQLPIIIATFPDVGATPDVAIDRSDPVLAARARQRIAAANAQLIALVQTLPNTYIARVDGVTDRIFDQVPFQINGTEFEYAPDRENPPLHLFCKDGFHPSTVGQALIANEILKAVNSFAATPIPLFSNREILGGILGQDPDQPLLDYMAGAGDDGDALPPVLEFLLDADPLRQSAPFAFSPNGTASYRPSPAALRYADLRVLQSQTLTDDWAAVPAANMQTLPDGTVKIIPTAAKLFYKFEAIPKP